MKIIDNKKDYYDYLMGVYGIDDKVVFDRRGSKVLSKSEIGEFEDKGVYKWVCRIYLKIGDYVYLFLRKSVDDCWYMPDVAKFGFFEVRCQPNPMPYSVCEINIPNESPIVMVYEVASTTNKGRERFDGIIHFGDTFKRTIDNPILSQFSFVKKFIKPEEIWERLYDYISKRNEPVIVDNRNDIQHLESAGFDKRTSFRNIKD